MSNFNSIVNGWSFAKPGELLKRIALAEAYATAHQLSDRQQRVLAEMREVAAGQSGEQGASK